jgi:MSHA pilin protein MshA
MIIFTFRALVPDFIKIHFCKANIMKNKQGGFTLIELVMVIVILGVLAAVALPKFVDLSSDAKKAAIDGAAGALSSYAAINYAAFQANSAGTAVVRVSNTGAGAVLAAGMATWDTKFSISGEVSCLASAAGATAKATLSYSGGSATSTSTATIICTG